MIEYIGKEKPEADEYRLHLRLVENLMSRYTRIGVFGLQESGKSRVVRKLMNKFEDTEWSFYDMGEVFLDGEQHKEPFVFSFVHPKQEPFIPKFDVIYIVQYSRAYKEAISGIRFDDDIERPMGVYMRYSDWHHYGVQDLRGKSVKNINALKKYIS